MLTLSTEEQNDTSIDTTDYSKWLKLIELSWELYGRKP